MFVDGKTISTIADTLRRNKGTVSRELMRNSEEEFYSPYLAQVKATSRRRQSKEPWKMKEFRICEYVKKGLREYWSPEQIAGRI
jgi:IS30 family transposase